MPCKNYTFCKNKNDFDTTIFEAQMLCAKEFDMYTVQATWVFLKLTICLVWFGLEHSLT